LENLAVSTFVFIGKSPKSKKFLLPTAIQATTHFEIAKFFLENKIPVLVEKPITMDMREAKQLIALAKKNKTMLSVGHVERYNNAYLAVKELIHNPLFIECNRISPFPNRSLDISVVLDLMIHDLDIILYLMHSKIKRIEAMGVKVLSASEDIANVRLTFANGCVANITASRISMKRERKLRIFMHNGYISIDYAEQQAAVYRKINNQISQEILPIQKEEPLKKEIADFVNMVRHNKFDITGAQKATEALNLALTIQKKLRS
jgi:predicted dehydrogenase